MATKRDSRAQGQAGLLADVQVCRKNHRDWKTLTIAQHLLRTKPKAYRPAKDTKDPAKALAQRIRRLEHAIRPT